jgi:hypothetical protein
MEIVGCNAGATVSPPNWKCVFMIWKPAIDSTAVPAFPYLEIGKRLPAFTSFLTADGGN